MAHSDDYEFYLECGCTNMDRSLGIRKMPEGYHLLLDSDDMYFFWMERATGRESSFHWNKWAVYRGAIADKESKK
jgi:hypothetical protein